MNRRPKGAPYGMALIALVALAATGCDVVFQSLNAQATDLWQRTYKLEEGGQVEIISPVGRIEVSPSADASTVEVVAERRVRAATEEAARQELPSIKINERVTPRQITVEVPGFAGGVRLRVAREVSFKVKVPRSAAVKVNTRNGEVRVSGVSGAVKADSSNGSIVGENLGGPVELGTTNGSIKVQMTSIPAEGIRLDTTNGSIDLRVPANSKANISARWINGGFEAEGLNPEGEKDRRRYDGKLNGGGPRVELNTTNGRIRISS